MSDLNEYTVVVFDLDETMGYFVELGMFWSSLSRLVETQNIPLNLNESIFYYLLDLYPEFLRPNIINILTFLKEKKINNECQQIMIYTNNQGSTKWPQMIKGYFENKIDYKLFNQIICAFKINGERVELNRTGHSKTYSDLVNCTKIPEHTRICFIDDTYYEGMNNDKIYYINIKPYEFKLPFEVLVNRFFKSQLWDKIQMNYKLNLKKNIEEYKDIIFENLSRFNFAYHAKTGFSYKIDKILSKKILLHLQSFFHKSDKINDQYHIIPQIKNRINKSKRHNTMKFNNSNKTLKRKTH